MAYGTTSGGSVLDASEAQGRDTNSIMAGWVDRGPFFYYDTLQALPGTQLASDYAMFTIAIGQQNPLSNNTVKSKLQTNMKKSGEFPPPRCLLLEALGYVFGGQPITAGGVTTWTPMFLDDIYALTFSSYFEFRIDDKIFHEGQIFMYPGGAGVQGTTTQSGQQSWTNGVAAPGYMRRYGNWSKYIAPLQQFSLNLIIPGTPPTLDANGPGLWVPIILDGLSDRSVQ